MTDYFSAQEVADRLMISIRSVRNYIKSGKLKSVKVGRLRRVSEEDLETFIGRRDQRNEIETFILKQQNKLIREAAEALAEWQADKKKSWIEEHQKNNPVLSMGSR
jgi:excisionase family DNA binding protein